MCALLRLALKDPCKWSAPTEGLELLYSGAKSLLLTSSHKALFFTLEPRVRATALEAYAYYDQILKAVIPLRIQPVHKVF